MHGCIIIGYMNRTRPVLWLVRPTRDIAWHFILLYTAHVFPFLQPCVCSCSSCFVSLGSHLYVGPSPCRPSCDVTIPGQDGHVACAPKPVSWPHCPWPVRAYCLPHMSRACHAAIVCTTVVHRNLRTAGCSRRDLSPKEPACHCLRHVMQVLYARRNAKHHPPCSAVCELLPWGGLLNSRDCSYLLISLELPLSMCG